MANVCSGDMRLGLDLALVPRVRVPPKVDGDGIGAGYAWHGSAAPVDGTPALAALGPSNTALKAAQFIELRLDHDLPGGVDQSPFATPEKRDQTTLPQRADAIGFYLIPSLSRSRQEGQLVTR